MKINDSVRVIRVPPYYVSMRDRLQQIGTIVRPVTFDFDWIVKFSDGQEGSFYTDELEVVHES